MWTPMRSASASVSEEIPVSEQQGGKRSETLEPFEDFVRRHVGTEPVPATDALVTAQPGLAVVVQRLLCAVERSFGVLEATEMLAGQAEMVGVRRLVGLGRDEGRIEGLRPSPIARLKPGPRCRGRTQGVRARRP